jgi:hypothetical protein
MLNQVTHRTIGMISAGRTIRMLSAGRRYRVMHLRDSARALQPHRDGRTGTCRDRELNPEAFC